MRDNISEKEADLCGTIRGAAGISGLFRTGILPEQDIPRPAIKYVPSGNMRYRHTPGYNAMAARPFDMEGRKEKGSAYGTAHLAMEKL